MVTLGEFNDRYGKLLSKVERLLDIQNKIKENENFKTMRTVKRGHFLQEKESLWHPEIASLLGLPKDYEELSIADLRSDIEALKEDIHQLFCDFDSEYASPWKRVYDHIDLKKIEMPEEADDFYDAQSEEQEDDPTFYDAQSGEGLVKKDERYFGDLKLCQQSLRRIDYVVRSFKGNLSFNFDPDPERPDGWVSKPKTISEDTTLDNLSFYSYSGYDDFAFYSKSASDSIEDLHEDVQSIVVADNTDLFTWGEKNNEITELSLFLRVAAQMGSTAMLGLVIEANARSAAKVYTDRDDLGDEELNNLVRKSNARSTAKLINARTMLAGLHFPTGYTVLEDTFNLPMMYYTMQEMSFKESNFDYLIKKGAKVSTESLQKAMMFANLIEDEGEKKYEKIFEKLIDAGVNPVSEGVDIIAWASSQNIRQPIIDVVEEVIARKQPGPSVSP